jgi:hypothetical protein
MALSCMTGAISCSSSAELMQTGIQVFSLASSLFFPPISISASGQKMRELRLTVEAAQLAGTGVISNNSLFDMSKDPPVRRTQTATSHRARVRLALLTFLSFTQVEMSNKLSSIALRSLVCL